jgi:hypothetical protein
MTAKIDIRKSFREHDCVFDNHLDACKGNCVIDRTVRDGAIGSVTAKRDTGSDPAGGR